MKLIELIKQKFPADVVEFDHAPYDFDVTATDNNLDEDEAQFFVTLHIGKAKKIATLRYRILVTTADVTKEES